MNCNTVISELIFDAFNKIWFSVPVAVVSEAPVVDAAAVVSFIDAVVFALVVVGDVVIDVVILVDEDVDVSINKMRLVHYCKTLIDYNQKKSQVIKYLHMSNLPAQTIEDKASAKTDIVVNRIFPISSDSCR